MSKDYTYFVRESLTPDGPWAHEWKVFISAFNGSERVRRVFDLAPSTTKIWIIHEEYGFDCCELPCEGGFMSQALVEEEMLRFWEEQLDGLGLEAEEDRVCLDATGFMRPQLMFLIKVLVERGVRKFDVLYSEPRYYKYKDQTEFAGRHITGVRQVFGYEGMSDASASREVLVIGTGFETNLISEVAEDKDQSKKIAIFGLPSLMPDMYQQNALRAWSAKDAIDSESCETHFAPASDIFATATVVSELIEHERRRGDLGHIYLAPLSTKAQAIGFALCALSEYQGENVSIIYPFTRFYEKETSVGIARVWRHALEF